jgi:hypothetical protein
MTHTRLIWGVVGKDRRLFFENFIMTWHAGLVGLEKCGHGKNFEFESKVNRLQ